MPQKHLRDPESDIERVRKRLAITVDSLHRTRLGLPIHLTEPYPVPVEAALEYLNSRAQHSNTRDLVTPVLASSSAKWQFQQGRGQSQLGRNRQHVRPTVVPGLLCRFPQEKWC